MKNEIAELQIQFILHREDIEKISRRVYDGLYQLLKIKFGFAENNSEKMSQKYVQMVQDKL